MNTTDDTVFFSHVLPLHKNTEVWRKKQELWIPTSWVWLLPCTSWPRASLAGPPPPLLVFSVGTILQRCRKLPGALCKRLARGWAPRPSAVRLPRLFWILCLSDFFNCILWAGSYGGPCETVSYQKPFHFWSVVPKLWTSPLNMSAPFCISSHPFIFVIWDFSVTSAPITVLSLTMLLALSWVGLLSPNLHR